MNFPKIITSQNKNKFLIGIALTISAFACAGIAFYFIGQNKMEDQKKIATIETQLANMIEEKAKGTIPSSGSAARGTVKLEDLLHASAGVYGETEKQRKEGFLWIDRRAQSFIITLGALNGLYPGSELSIYDGNRKIDVARVDTPFDIISYVKPLNTSLEHFDDNYYRVLVENAPQK